MTASEEPQAEIVDGWWSKAVRLPSGNCDQRPAAFEPELLVVHNISLPPGEFGGGYIEKFFLNQLPVDVHPWFKNIANTRVSAHCLIDRKGKTTQFVSFDARAWHAGESFWQGRSRCNDFSIGIELEGSDTIAYTDAQYATLGILTLALLDQYPCLLPGNILGHEHIAPGRKTDPGPAFDWERYRRLICFSH